jgi:hypothetical protein
MGGFDTADTINVQVPAAINKWGKPEFWVRYFSPCSFTPFSTHPNTEGQALWDANSSKPYLGAVTTPSQGRLSGSNAEGLADAQTFVSSMISAYHNVAPLDLPSGNELWCWLDQEAATTLSLSYWNGWAGYVNSYSVSGFGDAFYAALYCNPDAVAPNCSIIENGSADTCFAIWSSEPLKCGSSLANEPAWAPEFCNGRETRLWQFWDEGSTLCGNTSANVDLNYAHPSTYYPDFCFVLTGRP